MFFLSKEELDNALSAINHHGYSTMMPEPPEWAVVQQNWPSIRDAIEKIDLDTYEPFRPLKVFAPKNRANVRIMHLLHPQDLLIYTALVLLAKNDIEAARISRQSKRVFSYRADVRVPDRIYETRGAHDAYKRQLASKASKGQVQYVALADIADFYPRIYQHRLENVIESVASHQRVRDVARVLVRKLIGNIAGKNSYGIPVGPYASRLLAEALLIDVDAQLHNQSIDFVRWVDDYNIFCKTEYEAQSILFTLGEWLFSNHGLTLQSAKTKILTVQDFAEVVIHGHEATVADRDTVVRMFRDFTTGYDDSEGDEEPTEEEIAEALAVLQGVDLKQLLERSMADTSLVDYEAVGYALTKLPRIPGVSDDLKWEVLDLVIENAELLYPLAEQIAKYVLTFTDLSTAQKKRIGGKLLKPVKSRRRPPPPYYGMWMLHVLASGAEWNHAKDVSAVYAEATSEVVKRQAALALSQSGSRAEVVSIRDDFANAGPLVRLGLLVASRKLGADERKHWKLANGVSGAIEKLI